MKHHRPLGKTGIACHPLGFGCYRIHQGSSEHEAALRDYLDRGGNLIDTSANYTDGLSESLVGHVLRDYPRGKIVLVTKGGYIQGQNMDLARRRHFPEVVQYGEGIWHCIHPEFLATQVERSLARLKLESIDVYLLHNPEYFLTEKAHHGAPGGSDHEEFYRRIREAFRFLESEVDSGRIRWYGISSNNFGLPSSDPTMTSVSRCLEQARGLREDHHFRVVQLPMNLYEPGGALEPNTGGKTPLDFCRDEGLGVLINRPLNAIHGNRMIRLADFLKPGERPPGTEALAALLGPLRRHEQQIHEELQIPLVDGGSRGVADVLENLVPRLESAEHLEQTLGQMVISPLQSWLSRTHRTYAKDMRWQAWHQRYIEMLNPLFEELMRFLSTRQQSVSDGIRRRLVQAGYPERSESLSRMAMNVLAHLPGLDCVLNGMRRLEYVEDAMGVPELPPVDAPSILRNFQHQVARTAP